MQVIDTHSYIRGNDANIFIDTCYIKSSPTISCTGSCYYVTPDNPTCVPILQSDLLQQPLTHMYLVQFLSMLKSREMTIPHLIRLHGYIVKVSVLIWWFSLCWWPYYYDCSQKLIQSIGQHKELSQGALLLHKIEQQAIVQYLIERVAVLLSSQKRSFEEVS